MIPEDNDSDLQFSRRRLLTAAGVYGQSRRQLPSCQSDGRRLLPLPVRQPIRLRRRRLPACICSSAPMRRRKWSCRGTRYEKRSRSAAWVLGGLDGRLERTVEAKPVSYTDGKSKQVVYAYHAKIGDLKADQAFLYVALHDGAEPEFGTFRTSPRGRVPFTFTSFGDQGTPTLGRKFVLPASLTMANPPLFVNDNLGGPAGSDTTLGVERLKPLFHLFNGDLCYANVAEDRVRTWWDFWANNSRSARNRPWMPSPGNHENELGNGPIGYQAYQTYFSVPEATGQTGVTRGLWYTFTAGSVRVVSIANDDICYQDGGNSYVQVFLQRQKAWLEKELSAARADRNIDWLVVCVPGRHLDRRQVQRRGPRGPRGVGAAVRQI